MATERTEAIGGLNDLFVIANQLLTLYDQQISQFLDRYNNSNWLSIWQNLPTAALNLDGSLGTADATPNPAHPLDTRVVDLAGLQCGQPANTNINVVAALQAVQACINGGAVTTLNRLPVLASLRQG